MLSDWQAENVCWGRQGKAVDGDIVGDDFLLDELEALEDVRSESFLYHFELNE